MNIKTIMGKVRRTYKDYGLRGLIDKTKKHIVFKREQKMRWLILKIRR